MEYTILIRKSIVLWILLGIVECQDSPNYIFTPSSPAQGRFVPSFGNTRTSSFLSGSRNSLTTSASSFPDQLIFISNDGPSAPQSPQLTTGFAQFPQHLPLQQTTRNPDYYDISPRPFGVPTGSQSFSRPKALRPNNSGTGFGSLSTQQTRTNVPHQQTQFLAHFNEQNIPSSSAAASNFQINRINGGGRPFSSISGSTNSAFSKNRPFTSNTFNRQQQNKQPTNFNDEMVTPVQQQLPFRNTRTRFLPVSSKSSTAASTTITTSKPLRYNRFGSGRSPSTDNRQSTTTVSPRARQPAASVNKTLFQPRRPVIISREINRPFGIGGGRITIKHNGSDKNISSNVNEQEDDDIDESEEDIVVEEIREQNHVNKSEPKEKVFEKLSLHEAGASISISSSEKPQLSSSGAMPPTVPTSEKGQDDHTVILTSNFYLPGSFEDDEEQVDGDDGVEAEGEPTSKEIEEDQDISVTTQQPTDYDYEYDEVDTTIAPQLENASNYSSDFVTEIEPEVETKLEEFSVQGPKSVIGKLVTETPSPTEITTLPQESSAEYDENEEYEDGTGSGAGLVGSVDYLEGNTEKIPVNQVVGREVVSVVTTKSVINGSTAVPQSITPSTTTVREEQIISENTLASAKESSEVESESEAEEPQEESAEEQNVNNTTESYVVIASIQTSRSINGARFLPFPAIEQEETKQTLSELERKIHGKSSRKKVNQSYNESNETVSSNELQVDAYPINTTIPGIAERLLTVHETTTQATSSTTASRFAPNIRKFMPKTSPKPKINIDDIPMDDITSLLPAGFKPRPSYKNKKINKLTSTTTESIHSEEDLKPLRNSTISRSYKTSLNTAQDLTSAGLPPKGYRTTHASSSTTETYPRKLEDVLRKIKFVESTDKLLPTDYNEKITTPKTIIPIVDDISKFLPPGFKLPIPTTTNKPIIKIQDEITKFLPPGFKPAVEDKPELKISIVDDLSKLLPPGFKLESAPKEEPIDISKIIPKDFQPTQKKEDKANIFKKIELKDESGILPSGLTENSSVETTQIPFSTTTASSSFKVVFPKGLNKRPGHRLTTPKAGSSESNVATSTPIVIKKGPPMRITTEFTGWPTPSTTPISIEKLLEQSRTSTIDISELLPQSSTTSTSTTTTTTTTPEPPKPTKPGHCRSDCDLAGTIKIIDGVAWKPELLDHNTVEWKNLAREVEAQLNEVYSNAPRLSRWYKKVRIDSFSKGSVLVDYFVELANITQDVNTLEIKKMFHQALTQPPLPVVPLQAEVDNETDSDGGKDFKDNKGEKLVKETYLMGRFVVDPTSTDFIVIPKSLSPTVEFAEDDALIPHWAIVLIVIGIGSLCFVIIFGVTVLLNRQKRAKKTPIPLTADMMNDLKVNHMGGTDNYGVDDFYNIDDAWNDTKQPIKPKRFTNSMHGSSGSNIYDSWRSTRHGDYYYDSHNYTPHAKSEQYPPDAFADVHQMYTYNQPRSRYQRDYDPDF